MNTYAICQLSVAPMRKDPSDRSEMVNQVLFGEVAEVLDQNEKWYMVRLQHDQYEGWVDKKQLWMIPEKPEHATVNQQALLVARHDESTYYLPAGALLYEATSQQAKAGSINLTFNATQDHALQSDWHKAALRFLDAPYLWGGRTVLGMDCSGFTQIVYRLMGVFIARDAWQQAEAGEPIMFVDEAITGDLAFFDNSEGRITHVGIVLRNEAGSFLQIAHASGKVRVDRLDHQGIFNDELGTYTHTLRVIKRISY